MPITEELERRSAVTRYLSGERANAICSSLGRPRKWLYKWVSRFRSGDTDWFVDGSRRPKHSPSATPLETAVRIVSARQHLEQTPYACRGVFSIRQELCDDRSISIPSDATINRIISGAGLVRRTAKRDKVGTAYPEPAADGPNAGTSWICGDRGIWEQASPAMSSTSSMLPDACPAYILCPTSPLARSYRPSCAAGRPWAFL